jgi:hypothetical protein
MSAVVAGAENAEQREAVGGVRTGYGNEERQDL